MIFVLLCFVNWHIDCVGKAHYFCNSNPGVCVADVSGGVWLSGGEPISAVPGAGGRLLRPAAGAPVGAPPRPRAGLGSGAENLSRRAAPDHGDGDVDDGAPAGQSSEGCETRCYQSAAAGSCSLMLSRNYLFCTTLCSFNVINTVGEMCIVLLTCKQVNWNE